MEYTITRVITSLQRDLPDTLTQIGDFFNDVDMSLYGRRVPLKPPPSDKLYVYDFLYNDFDYPIINVMGNGYEKRPSGTVASPNLYYEDHHIDIRCLFRHSASENPEIITKGIHRYARAVEKVLRNNWDLRDENLENPISKSCEILDVSFDRPINDEDVFYRMFNISVRYKILDYYFRNITGF